MKLVLLYSPDGFDLDVLENQRDLYGILGCKVIWTDKIFPCDLIVILRANEMTPLKFPEQTPLLFIDYSGQNVLDVFKEINHNNKRCITSRKEKNIIEDISFGHPFVSLERYSLPLKTLKYEFIHIGNYKKRKQIKLLNQDFIEFINGVSAFVWGKNWPKSSFTKSKYMGPMQPKDVSKTYSQSKYSLGIKHDFQIGTAISGRYWQSTLNGCSLFVEDEYLAKEIPGIYLYGSKINDSRKDIQNKARDYWKNQNNLQLNISRELLAKSNSSLNLIRYCFYKIKGWAYRAYRNLTYGIK
jgi:hypothetical protein